MVTFPGNPVSLSHVWIIHSQALYLGRTMNFSGKKVSELQQFLKDRGVSANFKKASLIELCQEAYNLNIEVDPDGLLEDRQEILSTKLIKNDGTHLPNPGSLKKNTDLSPLPTITIIDLYNYLMQSQFNSHENLRDHRKLEGYTMAMDNHVEDLVGCQIEGHNDYYVMAAKIKPRTREKDPVTNLKFYNAWIVLTSSPNRSTPIYSALCICKGGIDGYCRHVQAIVFTFMQLMDDYLKKCENSVTSGPCQWVKKSKDTQEPVLATKIKTNITNMENDDMDIASASESEDDWYDPFPKGSILPDPEKLMELTKENLPNACLLDAFEIRPQRPSKQYSPPCFMTPMEKFIIFLNCHECTPSNICDSNCFGRTFNSHVLR